MYLTTTYIPGFVSGDLAYFPNGTSTIYGEPIGWIHPAGARCLAASSHCPRSRDAGRHGARGWAGTFWGKFYGKPCKTIKNHRFSQTCSTSPRHCMDVWDLMCFVDPIRWKSDAEVGRKIVVLWIEHSYLAILPSILYETRANPVQSPVVISRATKSPMLVVDLGGHEHIHPGQKN